MSADPNMMSQMLMQKLMQPQASPGTGQTGPGGAPMGQQGVTTPQNAAAQLVQKAMLIRALQGGATPQQMMQQHQANAMLPQTNAMIAGTPPPQVPPMQMPDSLTNQQIQAVNPALQPIPGNS
jgi:hypothetical protein